MKNLDQFTIEKHYNTDYALIYEALAYRWEDTADPEREDSKFFFELKQAIDYAKSIELEIGFHPVVEKKGIEVCDLRECEDELDTAEEYINYFDVETFDDVWTGSVNEGKNIEGAIVLVWSYEKHVGYARNFLEIRYGNHNELESDLVTTNHERVWAPVSQVLLNKSDIENLSDEEILAKVNSELYEVRDWKWNHFKNQPTDEKIIDGLSLSIELEETED